MEEAERECERIAIVDLGRLAAQGMPQELREEYGVPSLESFRDVRRRRRLSRRLA